MPGSSTIVGLIPCANGRNLHNTKPRTITMDAEIVIGHDVDGMVQTTTALLEYFIPFDRSHPEDGLLYFVAGKIASMDDSIKVGEGDDNIWVSEYDFIIEADVVRLHTLFVNIISESCAVDGAVSCRDDYGPCSSLDLYCGECMCLRIPSCGCRLTDIYTQAGKKYSEREFIFDIQHWVCAEMRTAGHLCLFPESNRRFADKAPLPRGSNHISVTGYIQGPAMSMLGDKPLRRICVEVKEIAFLSETVAAPSPVKGMLPSHCYHHPL
jgi:hypothetical protein